VRPASVLRMAAPSDEDVAEGIEAMSETYGRAAENPAVCVVDGWGCRVTVDGRHLVVADGMGQHRRERRYARATHQLARLVVVGASGMISLDALRWCGGAGVGVVVLDPGDGAVLATSGACSLDDARLRRAQGFAMGTGTGLRLARYLIATKLAGQAAVAGRDLGDLDAAESITTTAESLADAESLEEVRHIEAVAANVYWHAWEGLAVTFIGRDRAKVPAHWQGFGGRRSAVNPGTARSATDPLNAALNYSYRMLESAGRLATLALGLDPGMGVLHADVRSRDSFVLDLIEAGRPVVDRHVLRLFTQPMRRRDFAEDTRGVVRVLAPLTHRLAEAMPSYGAALAPVAEAVATLLGEASAYADVLSVPTALSGAKHKAAARRRVAGEAGRETRRRSPGVPGIAPRKGPRQRPKVTDTAALPLPTCRGCGGTLAVEADRSRSRYGWCETCRPERRAEIDRPMQTASLDHARAFAEATGVRPSHTAEATAARMAANARQRVAQQTWAAEHAGGVETDATRAFYLAHIAPRLATCTLPAIARATGISTSGASKWRAGRCVPHPRHLAALADLVGVALPGGVV